MALIEPAAVLPAIEVPVSQHIGKYLPSAVRNQLACLPVGAQSAFLEEFEENRRACGGRIFGRCSTATTW
jgi:hypothetical protein